MNGILQDLVREELCPSKTWQLTDAVKSVLICQICRLPRSEVSEIGTRYPQSPAEMRAFLVKFFTRHYFLTQNSLIDYMTSQDFLDIIGSGHLRILDIGSGPAVASLAITDMLACIIRNLGYMGEWPKSRTVKITYVLNDISSICLAAGQQMLNNYFRIGHRYNPRLIYDKTFAVGTSFPENMNQLRRISGNLGTYDIANLCYLVESLAEKTSFENVVNGLLEVERLCNRAGKILILIDKFNANFTRRLAGAISIPSSKEMLTQYVYPKRNNCDTHPYIATFCLLANLSMGVYKK